jgi:hypothetical protein
MTTNPPGVPQGTTPKPARKRKANDAAGAPQAPQPRNGAQHNGEALRERAVAAIEAMNEGEDRDKAEQERRERQRAENRELAEFGRTWVQADMDLQQMLAQFAYISDLEAVVQIGAGTPPMKLAAFKNLMAPSKETKTNAVTGKVTMIPVTKLWLEHKKRLAYQGVTFKPGAPGLTRGPNQGSDEISVNLWRASEASQPFEGWEKKAAMFVEHVRWLFGDQADKFLDWLAHIEQKPGELPHSGWLHVAPRHGLGRNWLASVLVKMWTGAVAPNMTMEELLGGFNGHRLSRKVLAVVDEVHGTQLGGGGKFAPAQVLRARMTSEVVTINQKYGAAWVEWNALRLLVFSNHWDSIPMPKGDRRFWVASCEEQPRDAGYYTRLYRALKDERFIKAVRHFLATRDISAFNPGERPLESAAKQRVVGANKQIVVSVLETLAARWPCDVIDSRSLSQIVGQEVTASGGSYDAKPPSARQLEEAGVTLYADFGGTARRVKLEGHAVRMYILRNMNQWLNEPPGVLADAIRAAGTLPTSGAASEKWERLTSE